MSRKAKTEQAEIVILCPHCQRTTRLGEAMQAAGYRRGCTTCGDYSVNVEVYCRNEDCGELLLKSELDN